MIVRMVCARAFKWDDLNNNYNADMRTGLILKEIKKNEISLINDDENVNGIF